MERRKVADDRPEVADKILEIIGSVSVEEAWAVMKNADHRTPAAYCKLY